MLAGPGVPQAPAAMTTWPFLSAPGSMVVGRGPGGLLGDVRGPGLGHDHLAAVDDQDEQRQRHEREHDDPQRHRAAVAAWCPGGGRAGRARSAAPACRHPRSSNGSSGAVALSPKVWLTGKPMTWKAARLATQDTVTWICCATAKSPAPTGAPSWNSWTLVAGAPPLHRAPRSDWAAAWALACASAKVRASEAAADRVAGGRAHLAGRAEPLAARAHQQQEQHEGGRRHHELDRHRAAVAA